MARSGNGHSNYLNVLFVCLLIAFLATFVVNLAGLGAIPGVVSMVAALAAATTAFFSYRQHALSSLRPLGADDLSSLASTFTREVISQWNAEWVKRRPDRPLLLPVHWSPAADELSDSISAIFPKLYGTQYREAKRRLTGSIDEISSLINGLPNRRIVILGEGGSGKSIIAIKATLDLARSREEGSPVPVLLSVSDWDAVSTDFRQWLADKISAEFPRLRFNVDAAEPSMELIRAGLVLPVLDGFDEMAPASRSRALSSLNSDWPSEFPLIVTSRPEEFSDAIQRSSRSNDLRLRGSAVVGLQPLETGAVVSYLESASLPPDILEILTTIAASSDPGHSAARSVVRSPLLLTMTVDGCLHDPELAKKIKSASNKQDIEGQVFEASFDSLFAQSPDVRYYSERSYQKTSAQRYLTTIAKMTTSSSSGYDFRWWELVRHSPRLRLEILAGILAGLAVVFLGISQGLALSWVITCVFCYSFLLGAGFTFGYGLIRRQRGQRGGAAGAFRGLADVPTILRRLGHSGIFVLALLATAIPGTWFLRGTLDWSESNRFDGALLLLYYSIAGGGLAYAIGVLLGCAFGFIFTMSSKRDNAIAPANAFTPHETYHRDRKAVLILCVPFGVSVCVVIVYIELLVLTLSASRLLVSVLLALTLSGFLASLMFTAWAPVLFARAWFGIRRTLPFGLIDFLGWAQKKLLLRQFGASYQFRHQSIQTYFVKRQQ